MSWKFVCLVCLIILSLAQIKADDIQDAIDMVVQASNEILENSNPGIAPDTKTLEEGIFAQESCQSNSCMISEQRDSGLFVFMSTSIPEGIWREYSHDLEKLGGKFILKGLPGDDFSSLIRFMNVLREKNILAPVEIDPELFDQYFVSSVPSIVLDNGLQYDKVDGTLSIQGALTLFSEKGSTQQKASSLKFEIQQSKAAEVLYAN